MKKHVHEWRVIGSIGAMCRCGKTMNRVECKARLNEYDKLKKATDALSAKQAEAAANSECHMHDRCVYENEIQEVQNTIDACQAYADILEGK